VSTVIISFQDVFGQNDQEKEIYRFISSTINSNNTKFNLREVMVVYPFTEDSRSYFKDPIFKQSDIDTFKLQIENNKLLNWNQSLIKNSNVISSKEIKTIFKSSKLFKRRGYQNGWEKFREKHGTCLTSYSLPLFSSGLKYCIFYQWTQCDYLMGNGSVVIYFNENGTWKYYKLLMSGIS
jgi:hypothetical protein